MIRQGKGMRSAVSVFFFITLILSSVSAKEIKVHRAKSTIRIDGKISATEWPSDYFQSGFIQMEPDKGQPSAEITKVAVQFDENTVYVAFLCLKSYPEAFVAQQSRRDQLEKKDDVVALSIDTYHDSRSAYWFMVNLLNTQVDARISDDGKYIDTEWDTPWEVKTFRTEDSWSAEFAIPFQSIRYDPDITLWGINFGRFIPKTLETSYWAGLLDSDFRISQSGTLTGLEFPVSSAESRFIPYMTTRYEAFSAEKCHTEIGADIEHRYMKNSIGNLTLNPDFATVEGDRERINMTRWELSFPEKRKFFLEGSDMFQNRIQAFYSRRIGEIDFGGKVIGKAGPYAFCVLGVRSRAVTDNPATSEDESFPGYFTGMVRLKRDVFQSSTIGLLVINKEWKGGFNRVLSLDGVFHFPKDFHLTTQFVTASPGPFSKNYGGFVRFYRENNIYHYHLRYTELAEDFRESVNGVGFIQDDNRRELDSAVEYKWWMQKGLLKFISYGSNYNIYWSKTEGHLRSWDIEQALKCYLTNKFSLDYNFSRGYELFEKGYNNYNHGFDLGYNTEEWSSTNVSYQFGKNYDLSYWMVQGGTRFKLNKKFSVEYELMKLTFNPDPEKANTWLSIATLNYQFTPDLYLRLFAQYRSATERIYVYGLFGWRFKVPNSAFYLVYTRDDSNDGEIDALKHISVLRVRNEILFLKFAYDFTL
jgi:hypothetical protein